MSWYLEDLRRLRDEREKVDTLAIEADWLKPIRWHMDSEFRLIFEAEIVTPKRVWPITLQYPKHFPHHPPLVLPRGENVRWSSHQYGPGGELCLEYGPDNWTPDMTGAMMLRSANMLLADENPVNGSRGSVPTRHTLTLGQEMRTSISRLLVTPELNAFFQTMPENTQVLGHALVRFAKESDVYLIHAVGPQKKSPVWRDSQISPKLVHESFEREATIIRLAPSDDLPPTATVEQFCEPLVTRGFTLDPNITVLLRGKGIYACLFFKDSESVYRIDVLHSPPSAQRLDTEHLLLKEKRVALVGCGSLGSKVATMLARSGVGHFVLVDDDILFPENFARNELDWRDAGTHKVDSLARRLELVNPSVKVVRRKHRLGAQEASSSVGTLLDLFDGSDLIIDATADPSVFNALSAVPKIPLIWGEVFGGGFGGLIARYRPKIEPKPQLIRRAIENWFQEYGPGKPTLSANYSGPRGEGSPMIADDADVSVIAAHTARYAIDLLVGREPSMFSASAYAIGLAKENVFNSPFETYPIEVGTAEEESEVDPLPPEEAAEEVKKLVEIVSNYATEAQAAAADSKNAES